MSALWRRVGGGHKSAIIEFLTFVIGLHVVSGKGNKNCQVNTGCASRGLMSVKFIKKRKRLPRIGPGKEIMRRERIVPFFKDIKELIKSSAKGTEAVLGKRIGKVEEELHHTQQALRATKEDLRGEIQDMGETLRGEMRDMEGRLTDKIDSIHTRVDDHETRITTLEGAPQ